MFVHLALIARDLKPKKKKMAPTYKSLTISKIEYTVYYMYYSIPTFLIRICVLDKASVP